MHTHTAALSFAEDKREPEFFYLLGLTIYSTLRECFYSNKDESSKRQSISNYQDIADGIRVCTMLSSWGE